MRNMWKTIRDNFYYWIFQLWLWFGIKVLKWPFVDIKVYEENKENVEAITFSKTGEYINKISNIE